MTTIVRSVALAPKKNLPTRDEDAGFGIVEFEVVFERYHTAYEKKGAVERKIPAGAKIVFGK